MNTININFPELGINQVEFLRNEILEHVIGPNHERGDGRLFQWQIIENDLKDFQRKQLGKMFDKRELVDGCYIHPKSDCKYPCPFHGPSNHPLKDAKIHIRKDKHFLVERICKHGVGHDDPDSVAYMHSIGAKWVGVHGCDGCCKSETTKIEVKVI